MDLQISSKFWQNFGKFCFFWAIFDDSFMNPPSSVRTVGKYQVRNLTDRPCALYPTCSNIFCGQRDTGLVKIISPDFHTNLNEVSWACFYHVDASLNGIEVQTQAKFVVKDTSKTNKSKKVTDITAAPTKKPASPGLMLNTRLLPSLSWKINWIPSMQSNCP